MRRCASNYIRPFINASPWQTLKAMVLEPGYATRLVQVLLEGYHFSCVECMRVCPRGKLRSQAGMSRRLAR
jgi:epoxyqueuosine reductase QueG